jgi:diguanylate cyclase (GGDEF)-like protein/PAS domain S-box-containing protein
VTGRRTGAAEPYEDIHSLRQELAELREKLREYEQTMQAIRLGEVDALLIGPSSGVEQVYTLSSADRPYRNFVESMSDGAATVSEYGIVLYANQALSDLVESPCEQIVGEPLVQLVTPNSREALVGISKDTGPIDLTLQAKNGRAVPVRVSCSAPFRVNGRSITCYTVIDLTGERLAEAKLEHLAQHDALTGLPNRTVLTDRIRQALADRAAAGGITGLLFCDVDGFKNVNDAYGHQVGDDTLRVIALRLTEAVRPGDTVARIGGDEFVVLCRGLTKAADAVAIATRIRDAVALPTLSMPVELDITISIGIALAFDDDMDASPDSLLRDADEAMYKAKRQGTNVVEIFDEPLRLVASSRLRTLTELRRAKLDGELMLYYQPVMDLAAETRIGDEALIRWRHPTRGLVPPDQFIPFAESSGLIIDIGAWVLREACRQAADWSRSPRGRSLDMSVNVSSRQLAQGAGLVTAVRLALDESGIDPRSLVLEVTESALMDDAAAALRVVNELKSLGVRIAIDAFGIGYSSLVYLKNFPVDLLKIDRSFVSGLGRDKDDTAIVRSVIDLAHALEIEAVAEGIETRTHLEMLQSMGCGFGQGFLWSPAVPPQDAVDAGGPPVQDLTHVAGPS